MTGCQLYYATAHQHQVFYVIIQMPIPTTTVSEVAFPALYLASVPGLEMRQYKYYSPSPDLTACTVRQATNAG